MSEDGVKNKNAETWYFQKNKLFMNCFKQVVYLTQASRNIKWLMEKEHKINGAF